MDTHKRISLAIAGDVNQKKLGNLRIASSQQDKNHLQRRKQQRAIDEAMIKVALLYGRKHFHKGATVFTLNDRSLRYTPYSRFTDALRGLRVVCFGGLPNPRILTTYWHLDTKKRVRR
ncbi:MAG: hypothetical protein WA865_03235 [Spirulinaceae cyanobacterium]